VNDFPWITSLGRRQHFARVCSSKGGDVSSCYLPTPQGTLRRAWHEFYIRLAYNVWRRQISTFGRWSSRDSIYVLECGTGPGFLLICLGRWFPKAILFGLDVDFQLICEAQTKTTRSHFVQASATQIPFSDTTFDLVIALHLIEHLPEPAWFFAEARRVLRNKGLLMIATPNPKGMGARLMGERWAGWQDESHINLNPPAYWRELIRGNGFVILKDGTTGLSGIPVFRKLPMALFNWVPLFLFGFFPWEHGEAYVCVASPCR